MNTLSFNPILFQEYKPHFGAKVPKVKKINQIAMDVVELSKAPSGVAQKLEFSEIEAEFNEVLISYRRLERNIKTEKENLKYYYSSQDKYDYKELLRQKRNLNAQLKRIAKRAGIDPDELECEIDTKKQYNRYISKILKAKTQEELNQVKQLINTDSDLYSKPKEMLADAILKQQKTL